MQVKKVLEDRFYYLKNFEIVLAWVRERYSDLLDSQELDFIGAFNQLPAASKALFVRMVMRKGSLFRASKLRYEEIGDTRAAVQPLIHSGWIEADPCMTIEQLFALLTKEEVVQALGLSRPQSMLKKTDMLEAALAAGNDARRFSEWYAESNDHAYAMQVSELCDRMRLLFFGNLHQDWSEFVLSDLGVFTYEKVDISPSSRAFHQRQDVDHYLHLYACRERFENEEPLEEIVRDLSLLASDSSWLAYRRDKLIFHIAQRHEQRAEWQQALTLYSTCPYPGARVRAIRVMEKCEQIAAAMELAQHAQAAPESELETQQLARIMPRLRRKLGQPKLSTPVAPSAPCIELTLPFPTEAYSVEMLVRDHLESETPNGVVHYVENTLINSLFGLLCWDAIFTAIPGAFFHPFHIGPADLHHADFYSRRATQFNACLSQLQNGQYKKTILDNYQRKAGIQSPFVVWDILSDTLLEHALACLPAAHLSKWFERILLDIKSNCAGYPDLIQFWPDEQRYRMIEVKGPGDKLQDNQVRLLDYCMANDMPVAVCYVQWEETAEQLSA
jgi:hypothetical protein